METRELADRRFRCLEGCGFCCTFQPEVSQRELALLRARVKPKPVNVTFGEGRTYLQLQNKCGACTFLSRRGCTVYDQRPQHCRYFPFHVHFSDKVEVYLNYTCRGVEAAPGADLAAEFQAQVVDNSKPEEWKEHERAARETYAEFKRRALRAGAWGEVEGVLAAALADGPRLFTAEWVDAACRKAGETASAADAREDAISPFHEPEVQRRPFYLTPDLRWLTFGPVAGAPGSLEVLEMDETGALKKEGRLDGLDPWEAPPPAVAEGLFAYLRGLTGRGVFAGGVYALVDDSDYRMGVEAATWLRLAEMATDLSLRASMLARLGTPEPRLADEAARFYDTTFLDAPTIGGFL